MAHYPDDNSKCRNVQARLSDYTDNTLSARQVWEVEKHLTDCADCVEISRQMQAMVRLLRAAERRDTADDFMARLHTRLDGQEPEPAPVRFGPGAVRDWLFALRENVQRYRLPALGLGISAVAVTAIVLLNRPGVTTLDGAVVPLPVQQITGQPLKRNVALAANNPFDDPVAANLEAHSALNEAGTPTETE